MYNVEDIRELFRNLKAMKMERLGTIEIQAASFIADQPTIFGSKNDDYIAAEIAWYESCSLKVDDLFRLYGREVSIWKEIVDDNGCINSNYGFLIYSADNGYQFNNCVRKLRRSNYTRQASMIYTRPDIHTTAGKDFICTYAVSYHNNDGYLDGHVYMRSNDIIFGYANDFAWQQHVLNKLAADTNLVPNNLFWHASSLHCYKRHWDLIK